MRKTCLNEIYKLAQRDQKVLFFGSDISGGTLEEFRAEMPERFFMEGISEANIIGMISGLAMNGKIPYFNTIGTFLTRRCYEQILLDAAMQNLDIRLVGSGGGLVYASLGCTHLSFQDFAILRAIPNMTIVAPCDAEEMKRFMPQTLDYKGPIYIRLAKGGDPVVSSADKPFQIGKAIRVCEGNDILMVTTGITLQLALEAAEHLKEDGLSIGIVHMHTVKPLDGETLLAMACQAHVIMTVEEHSSIGGLGSAVADILMEEGLNGSRKFVKIALPDVFPEKYGSQESLMGYYGVSVERIVEAAQNAMINRKVR